MTWADIINIINKIETMNEGLYHRSNFWFQTETVSDNSDARIKITIKEYHPYCGEKNHFIIFVTKDSDILIHDFNADTIISIQTKNFDLVEYTLTMGRPSSEMILCFNKIKERLDVNNVE